MLVLVKLQALLKLTLLNGCFSRFLNCKNGTKSQKRSHIRNNFEYTYIFKMQSFSPTYPLQYRYKYVLDFTRYTVICFRNFKYSFCIFRSNSNFEKQTLCEMCPNTDFFLVRIFPYSVKIRENTDQKKLLIWTFFAQ